MNKLRQMISTYRNDGTDPRKNDAWRVLLFSLNYAGGAALTFVNKIASSGVGIITMAIMAFCGFGGSGEASVVPENVFVNYRFYYCVLLAVFILPALGHLVTFIAMRKYPLTDEVMQKVSMKIAAERGLIADEKATEEI